MGYQPPALAQLRTIAQDLKGSYKGTNPQRLSFIALLEKVTAMTQQSTDDTAKKVLLGTILFQLERIRSEYRLIWPERSTMYKQLMKLLNITSKNNLGDDERLVYLYDSYKFTVMRFNSRTMQALVAQQPVFIWQNKDTLSKRMKEATKAVRKRDAARIDMLVHATPEVDALQKNTAKLAEQYLELVAARQKNWFGVSADRERLLKFINFMHHACNYLYRDANKQNPEVYDNERAIRRGLILFALMRIDSGYRFLSAQGGWFTSGSDLFKESLEVLNIASLDQISAAEKAKILTALQTRMTYVAKLEHDTNFKMYLANHKVAHLTDPTALFKTALATQIQELDRIKHKPTGTSALFSYAAHSTASYAVRKGVASYAVTSALGVAAATVGGVPGVAVYAGGKLFMSGLGKLLGDGVVNSASAGICAWLLDKIGGKIGSTAVAASGMLTYQYSHSRDGIAELRGHLSPHDELLFCDWVNTLLALPSDMVNDAEKEGIRYVFGLERGATLLPIQQPVDPSIRFAS